MPADVALMLYKAYIIPHLEYCSPLLLGIKKSLNNILESANCYALKALLILGNSVDYNSILSIVNMQSLEYRRYNQSLILLFKCIKENGPDYISNLFEHRKSYYNLRNSGDNLVQPSYHNRYYHNTFTYKMSHLWNQLPSYIKTSSACKLRDFCTKLRTFDFKYLKASCKFNYCLS